MKNNSFVKKAIAFLLSITMLVSALFVVPVVANATTSGVSVESYNVKLWADASNVLTQDDIDAFNNGTKTSMVGAVGTFRRNTSDSKYYLFLPSTADCTKLKLWYSVSGNVTIDGTSIKNGEETDIFADVNEGGVSKTYSLKFGSSSYTLAVMKSGKVGAMYIDTESGSMSTVYNSSDHSKSEAGTIMVVNENGEVEYDGAMDKIQGRGNATWESVKRPYNVKLAESTSLLGMSKAKKWCLLANATDDTLIRDQLTYDFAKYIGVKYQPIMKPIDLYINQQYYGSYQLAEKVEIKSNRINVTDAYENLEIANGTVDETTGLVTPADLSNAPATSVSESKSATIGQKEYSTNQAGSSSGSSSGSGSTGDWGSIIGGIGGGNWGGGSGSTSNGPALVNPSDITGGYLYELEISKRWVAEKAGFCAYNRQGWVLKSCDVATKEMVDYSYDLLYAMGSSVYNNGTVPSTTTSAAKSTSNPAPATKYQGMKWYEILDADSAVKYYWTQEYFKNLDSSTTSTYFYKDSDTVDTKVYAGPMWDMDNSLGFDKSTGSRWGHSWVSYNDWYTKYVRIYRFSPSDSTVSYTTDSQVPLSFYGALANNEDFWQMASSEWYNNIAPAVDILLGKATDPTGVLKSTREYVENVSLSNTMDNVRNEINSSNPFDEESRIASINDWLSKRANWITGQIAQVNISNATVSTIPSQTCNGNEIKPEITLTYKGVTLQEGTDYTLEYSNNVTASKNATITITGKGLYTGSVDKTFTIASGSLSGGSVVIEQNAYAGDTLSAKVKNADDVVVPQFVKYQWKANGTAIAGATDATYTIADAYKGAEITVTVSGDGTNITTLPSITSNTCSVLAGERPTGYVKTIANWTYDYTAAPDALATADETGETYYYTATSGENAEISNLTASVDAVSQNKIKWSGTADLYLNDEVTDQAPVIGTSKTDNRAWGEYPYFEVVTSTVGYEDVTFSAKLGGTKKGPRDWKLQYSLDGVTYKDVENATYSIVNNKTMELAFDNVSLPAECNNVSGLRIRMVVYVDAAINGINAIIGATSGDAAVNNVSVNGRSTGVVTKLEAPVVETTSIQGDKTKIFDTDIVTIADTNGGADVLYTLNDGEPMLYTEAFNPFDSATAKEGDKVTIKAWANFGDINSSVVEYTVEFGGVNLVQFVFDDYSKNVSNGIVFSNGGVYGESGKMEAYADNKNQYVPVWNASNGAFCLAPDDGQLWTEYSGFYFEVPVAGYEDINFTAQAYTTAQGPNSVSLQYSTDGKAWTAVKTNTELTANGALSQLYMVTDLSINTTDVSKIYIRVITTENKTKGSETTSSTKLHNNNSKGNLYINNVVISGVDTGAVKMPYTNKTTNYFGTGTIKYYSPSGETMQYVVLDAENSVILSGAYPEEGINISSAEGFNNRVAGDYTVYVIAGDDDDRSLANVRHYYYKGETVTKFNYNETKHPLANYLDETGTVAKNTSGANEGTLSMFPDAINATTLTYTGTYGVKVSKPIDAPFAVTKELANPSGNGYWLIKTSTVGYTDLTLNLEQLSSNKGPRDWGLAYSLDGVNYTYLTNSNVRAISNDSSTTTVETYNNYPLPAECNDREQIYIKLFINGGEAVNGKELELVDSGNTGINNIELSGVAIAKTKDVTITIVALEDTNNTVSTDPVEETKIKVNGRSHSAEGGVFTIPMTEGESYTIEASVNGTFVNEITTNYAAGDISIPVVIVDVNSDGVINAKDYAIIRKQKDDYRKGIFQKFVNIKEIDFIYK